MVNKSNIYFTLKIGTIVVCLAAILFPTVGGRINISSSIPMGLYWKVDDSLYVGDYVLVNIKKVVPIGFKRGYSHGLSTIGKRIIALAGATVRVSPKGVYVNGHHISNSIPLIYDSKGRSMPRLDSVFILLKNQCFLMGENNPRSFDSRYFGPISIKYIKSSIIPVITF